MSNPFQTTFGIEPLNYIKRIKETQKIIDDFEQEIPSNYVYLLTGLRGSGKTVLLSTIANYFMEKDNWIVVDPGPKDNLYENIVSELYETSKVKKLFIKKEFNFSFHGISFSISGDEPISSINTLMKKILDVIKKKNKKVLITIDEIDNSEQIKTFVQAYQSLIRLKYPVMLLMTGLYDNIYKLQDDKALTFLYRAPKILLDPLNLKSIELSYMKYLNVSEDLAKRLAKITNGYAYAYQVLGYLFYDSKSTDITDDLLNEFDQYLKEYVYDKLYSELSLKEKEILSLFKSNAPISMKELSINSNHDIKYLSVYRDRLIKKGILVSKTYGQIEFSLPRFYEYLNDNI